MIFSPHASTLVVYFFDRRDVGRAKLQPTCMLGTLPAGLVQVCCSWSPSSASPAAGRICWAAEQRMEQMAGSNMPPCSEPGPIQHERDLLVAPEACCMSEDGAGKTRRGWPKIWRAHSDGTESEKVDGANECHAQPYGDSKSPLEVDK